jgi:hypothetical protein
MDANVGIHNFMKFRRASVYFTKPLFKVNVYL